MTAAALILVLLSAIAHATWNFLLKRSNNQGVFIWWMLVSICVLFSPLAVVLAWLNPIEYPGWWFLLGTALLHALYFLLLGRSYGHTQLSLAYPIARGMGPVLVPIMGVVVLGEVVTPQAVAGIVAVILGIYTVYWWGRLPQLFQDPFKLVKETGTRYAMFTGLVIAVYSVWDKEGVRYVNPLLYMYLMTLGTVLSLTPGMVKAHGVDVMRTELRASPRSIAAAAPLTFLAYGLVLTAMRFSRVSYIAPAREIGIVISVLLGTLVLKEPFGRGRIAGSVLITIGLVLIATAK